MEHRYMYVNHNDKIRWNKYNLTLIISRLQSYLQNMEDIFKILSNRNMKQILSGTSIQGRYSHDARYIKHFV